ncbi:hypothetical protein CG51_19090 [Haematobacter missouriensis]|nr:hypothetical protein CG51_19090 [Haematobacter missouriensis]
MRLGTGAAVGGRALPHGLRADDRDPAESGGGSADGSRGAGPAGSRRGASRDDSALPCGASVPLVAGASPLSHP